MENKTNTGKQQQIETLERNLIEEVLKGHSARLPINNLCYESFRRGILTEGKFGFIREIAEIMSCNQPGHKLNLGQIARELRREPQRVETIAAMMTQFGFLEM